MTVLIPYESRGFLPALPDGFAQLSVTWDDLLWAAITVGRPNRQDVFAHGDASLYEAIFRWSMIRMAVEQRTHLSRRLVRTDAFRTLDPSEKGAVSYFLGLTIAKLFAAKLLQAPWLMHLDVYRPRLNAILKGRSRPDLVGQTRTGDWIALECKGRISKPDAAAKRKAKDQATRIVSIGGVAPVCAIGAVTFFAGDSLQFYWRDPEPGSGKKRAIDIDGDPDAWRHYYGPVLALVKGHRDRVRDGGLVAVEHADAIVGIHPAVFAALEDRRWSDAMRTANKLEPSANYRSDGIAVVAGPSWKEAFKERDLSKSDGGG